MAYAKVISLWGFAYTVHLIAFPVSADPAVAQTNDSGWSNRITVVNAVLLKMFMLKIEFWAVAGTENENYAIIYVFSLVQLRFLEVFHLFLKVEVITSGRETEWEGGGNKKWL